MKQDTCLDVQNRDHKLQQIGHLLSVSLQRPLQYKLLEDCVNAIWSFKESEGPPLSVLVIFFHKRFQSHCNDASILYIKWGNNNKLCISQLPPLGHTPLITALPITGYSLQLRWRDFDIGLCCCHLNSHFFLILLYIFQIDSMFINKVLQVLSLRRGLTTNFRLIV